MIGSVIALFHSIPLRKSYRYLKKAPEDDMKKQYTDFKNSDKTTRNNICNQLKSTMKLNEFEALVYISHLASEILPKSDEENLMFDRVLEKLLLMITGINQRRVNYKPGEKNENVPNEVKELFRKFNVLINFLVITLKTDYDLNVYSLFQQTIYANNNQMSPNKVYASNTLNFCIEK